MDILLRLKHWQVFSILISILIISNLIDSGELARDISYVFFIIINIGWILLLGTALKNKIATSSSRTYLFFLGTGFTLIVLVFVFRFSTTDTDNTIITDYPWLFGAYMVFGLFGICFIYGYVMRTLKSIEKGQDIDINDYFVDVFRLMFWPIGIWTIQPRLNNVLSQ